MICFIDYRCSEEELNSLINLGITPIKIPKTNSVYTAIDGHVDIQLNIINKAHKTVIVQKNISKSFLNTLENYNIKYVLSKNSLKNKYPNDIILNALITNDYFIHNIKYTDPYLLNHIKDKKIINVKQGYTKCSILPINDHTFITSDKTIYSALKNTDNNDVLLVPPGDILLPSMNYGFIGGVGGMISPNKIALFGELSSYKYGNLIYDFLNKRNISIISLKKGKLIDRGSLFTI